jgi:hypothetical protein
MRHPLLFASALLAVAAAGCAARPPQTAPMAPRDYYFKAPPERVWNALLLVYTDLNIPIENMERASWFMRSRDTVLPRADAGAWVDCAPRGAKGVVVTINVTSVLRASGDSTAMRLNVHADASRNAGANARVAIPCNSIGVLEQRVIESVRQRL